MKKIIFIIIISFFISLSFSSGFVFADTAEEEEFEEIEIDLTKDTPACGCQFLGKESEDKTCEVIKTMEWYEGGVFENFLGTGIDVEITEKNCTTMGEELNKALVGQCNTDFYKAGCLCGASCFWGGIGQRDSGDVTFKGKTTDAGGFLNDPFAGVKGISDYKQLKFDSVPELIGNLIKTALGFIGSIALVMFVGGGFLWMTAMGNAERQKKAMNMILWSSLGVLVILSSYVIVSFVLRVFGVS